jgi:DNA-directed RNA polymerase subunit RPC12/RpoP
MEEGKKKAIMITIIVVCLAAAGAITYVTRRKGLGDIHSIQPGTMIWIKCRNPKCENEWQMDAREYYDYLEANRVADMTRPAIVCPKCGEESGYIALKCPKCGAVFEKGSVPNAPSDKCPKCGYSKREERMKQATSGEQPTTENQQ